jgi:hypothetical protein
MQIKQITLYNVIYAIDLSNVSNLSNDKTKTKIRSFSQQANYTDRATASFRRS